MLGGPTAGGEGHLRIKLVSKVKPGPVAHKGQSAWFCACNTGAAILRHTGTWKPLIYDLHCPSRRRQWHPLQYSCLKNPMDGGAWKAAVHGVAEGQTRLSDFTFTFHFHALEKGMATHSSVLAWRIPGTGEPGGLPSMGSHRARHD